jgi:hypothetical protein
MPCDGFEPMTSVSEWAKTVHALDYTATGISAEIKNINKFLVRKLEEIKPIGRIRNR